MKYVHYFSVRPGDTEWILEEFKNDKEAKKFGKKYNYYILKAYFFNTGKCEINITKIIFEPFK